MPRMRDADLYPGRGSNRFFLPSGPEPEGPRDDCFFLAYGGLRWGFAEVMAMPRSVRRDFVERLKRQREFEQEENSKPR